MLRVRWIGRGGTRATEAAAPAATEGDLRAGGCRWIGGGDGPCGAIGCCRVWETWRGASGGSNGRPSCGGSNGEPPSRTSRRC